MVIHRHAFLLLRSCCPTDPADDKVYIHKQSAAGCAPDCLSLFLALKVLASPPPSFFPYSAASLTLPACTDFSRYTAFPSPATCTLPSALRGSSLHTRTNTPSVLCLRSAAHHPASRLYLSSEYFSPQSVSASISFSLMLSVSEPLSPSLSLSMTASLLLFLGLTGRLTCVQGDGCSAASLKVDLSSGGKERAGRLG